MPITSETDVVTARQQGRALAMALGFTSGNATLVATAISELARNIVFYAKRGGDRRGADGWSCDGGPDHHRSG